MSIGYTLLDPTGNTTILVTTPVPAADQPSAAAKLMEAEPAAEQVGFLSKEEGFDTVLRMAGGEFCGNASMCAAVMAAADRNMDEGTLTLRVSGASGPVKVRVKRQADGSYEGTVAMPCPVSIEERDLPGIGRRPVVFFDGIAHIIIEEKPDKEAAEALAPHLVKVLGSDAVGLMFLDYENETLTPLVYVPEAGTLFWENSCASGTTAAGAYLAAKEGRAVQLTLRQPGGNLSVTVREDGQPVLTGSVRILKRTISE